MEFNIFKLKVERAKRIFFLKEDMEPKMFAKNLSRVNNLKFRHSKDLIWVEVPENLEEIKPKEVLQYKQEDFEIIKPEEEQSAFIGVIYGYIRKLFLDNGYFMKGRDTFISFDNKISMPGVKGINCYVGYKVKIEIISDKYYISISPSFAFLSEKNGLESEVKGSYLLNIKSGRSFPYIASANGILTIEVPGGETKETEFAENYYFNFSSEESEHLGFSKEIHSIYKEYYLKEMGNSINKLKFLNPFVDLDSFYKIDWNKKISGAVKYIFNKGESYEMKEIFKYSGYDKIGEIKMLFFFESMEDFYKNSNIMKKLFSSRNSIFYKSLKQLGFEKIGFVKNPKTDKSIFLYNPETQQINSEDQDFIETLDSNTNYIGIIILNEYLGDIEPMIRNFPKNVIMQPILKENLTEAKAYIIKSYAFKLGNFIPNKVLYKIHEMNKYSDSLFIGMDISHRFMENLSSFSISAVTNNGQILYIKKYTNLILNEKMNIDILEKEFINCFNRYTEHKGEKPKHIFYYRDGRYIEDLDELKNIANIEETQFAFIEANKSTNVNATSEIKDNMISLSNDKFIYFPKTFFHQKGVELRIINNETDISNFELGMQGFYLTKLYYGSPYTGIKMPYPIHIADKAALNDYEWRLYIPYLK